MSEKVYGLSAEFDSPAAILHAAEKVRDAGGGAAKATIARLTFMPPPVWNPGSGRPSSGRGDPEISRRADSDPAVQQYAFDARISQR